MSILSIEDIQASTKYEQDQVTDLTETGMIPEGLIAQVARLMRVGWIAGITYRDNQITAKARKRLARSFGRGGRA